LVTEKPKEDSSRRETNPKAFLSFADKPLVSKRSTDRRPESENIAKSRQNIAQKTEKDLAKTAANTKDTFPEVSRATLL
jgi:hypothetical protein